MKKLKYKPVVRKILADTVTPVSIYMRLRTLYPKSILLESSDYHGHENAWSFICFNPLASFTVANSEVTSEISGNKPEKFTLSEKRKLHAELDKFYKMFEMLPVNSEPVINGLFGYISYDAAEHFTDLKLSAARNESYQIPEVKYSFYKYIVAIDHHRNQIHIVENLPENETSQMDYIHHLLVNLNFSTGKFMPLNNETTNFTDDEFRHIVSQGIEKCLNGELMQIVLSRQFSREYEGDDFNVYRALRSINPSPYLFYFDYGSYRIFGSSPEAELRIKNNKAGIFPIAGTFRRTGNDELDREIAEKLSSDPKENAEHRMLVDLACSDLGKSAVNVKVETYREVQFYSHVIHLVSHVSGELKNNASPVKILGETFPAGTLSGSPRQKAMEMIDRYENQNRGFYGGCIGYLGFDRTVNHAIMIRSFLSRNNRLFYQAGAGIVAASDKEKELQEVNNKLAALKSAIEMAREIN